MKKNKNTLLFWIFIILILSFIIYSKSYSKWECKYEEKISRCLNNNKIWFRAITDFICVKWSKEKVTYQIILDEKFKETDKEIESYLKVLEKNKTFYFWKNAKYSYLEWVENIERTFWKYWEFWKKYKKNCSEIVPDALSCFEDWKTSNVAASNFFSEQWTDCMKLAWTKLYIGRQVAYNLLQLNKSNVRKDNHKLYVQEEKKKYNQLIDLININLWYIERIYQKWPSKTKNVH